MHVATSITISAPVESVWAVLTDLERWPDWTASMRSVRALGSGPTGVGSRFEVRQPRMPVAVWEVTEFEPGRSFTWSTRAPGVRVVAHHELRPTDSGTRADMAVDMTGPMAGLVTALSGQRIRGFVRMETDGLRQASERTQP
ncbi:MAG TPA: SRPBCC family protein [Mycobacteriales bacterium]|nr:SRPBCC family protein [Mycobacteriales bacterium]